MRLLRHYRMPPSQWLALPESDQRALWAYELHRTKQRREKHGMWRGKLIEKKLFTPETATLLMLSDEA